MTQNDNAAASDAGNASPSATPAAAAGDTVRGRSCFCVEITGVGLAVHTVFAGEDGRVLPMPAVFPDVHSALEQIDSLRQIVIDRFAEAARVGALVIAEQRARGAATGQRSADSMPVSASSSAPCDVPRPEFDHAEAF